MVKVYSGEYPKENKFKEQENYNFELDRFQKYAVQSNLYLIFSLVIVDDV